MDQLSLSYEVVLEQFQWLTKNAAAVQNEVLERILSENAGASYLHKHGLTDTTMVSFKSLVPLITHSDIEEEIQRAVDGDKSPVLTNHPIDIFALSSGTSKGKKKLIPMRESIFLATNRLFHLGSAFRSRCYPLEEDGKAMEMVFAGKQLITKGGCKIGPATTNYFHHEAHKVRERITKSIPEVTSCPDLQQAIYGHLLFGLHDNTQVQYISSTFLYTLLEVFKLLEKLWKDLASDIEHGVLSEWITDSGLRKVASERLRPNPELAQAITDECSKGFQGIIPRLWPKASYILSIMTGTMEAYVSKMRYYAGNLPLVSADYGASETWIGVNTDPLSPPHLTTFTVVPDLAFFEFIPLKRPVQPQASGAATVFVESTPVNLTEVQVGEEYEVVVTTFSGLYRYRLGDVVRVAGFYNSTPRLSYVCRKDVLLNINVDRNSEKDLQMVLEKGAELLTGMGYTVDLVDYTSFADRFNSPGHYVIFVELTDADSIDEEALQAYCNCLDKSFVDPGYNMARAATVIGPLELCIVESGTFSRLAQRTGSINQYKTPRCVSAPEILQLLRNGVTKRYFSL